VLGHGNLLTTGGIRIESAFVDVNNFRS